MKKNILISLDGDRLHIYNGSKNQESLIMNMNSYIIEKCKDNKKKINFPFDYHWNEYGHYIVANQIEKSNFLILQD